MKIRKTTFLLIITNLVSLFLLLAVALHYDLPQKLLHRSGIIENGNGKYLFGETYGVRRTLFDSYRPANARIVMLGDSITYQADWNELLSRNDVVNRGIAADTTKGFFYRLDDVFTLQPDACFIMGGINDIVHGVPVKSIFKNYVGIIEALRAHRITPIVQSTLYVSPEKSTYKVINQQVNALNALLKTYAGEHGIIYLDINSLLATHGYLNPEYTFDGVHLLGRGYARWREFLLSHPVAKGFFALPAVSPWIFVQYYPSQQKERDAYRKNPAVFCPLLHRPAHPRRRLRLQAGKGFQTPLRLSRCRRIRKGL